MINIKLKNIFEQIGYNIDAYINHTGVIKNYIAWYYGIVETFHRYYIFNGDQKILCRRFSMGLPKKICENFADILCNEKVAFSIPNENSSKKLNELLKRNNFHFLANQSIEKTFALGFGAFVLSIEPKIGIKIQFVSADNVIPLTYDADDIQEAAFISDTFDLRGEKIRYIQVHRKDENDNYVIYNYRYFVAPDGEMTPAELDNLPLTVETGSNIPWFAIIKPNLVNNLDMNSPFGLPIYFNSLDVIKSLDIMYDSFVSEIQNGRKRLFVSSDALRVNSVGNLQHSFDPNDVIFYLLDNNLGDSKAGKYVQEVNGDLRVNELRLAIQTNLEILSFKLGFGTDFYKFENGSVMKTATEVIASNTEIYNTIHKHEIVLSRAFIAVAHAMQYISKTFLGENIDGEVIVDFDDSVIESSSSRREQDRKDVEMGAMSLAEYRSIWYNEPIDVARQKIVDKSNNKYGDLNTKSNNNTSGFI